ncbi:MAG: hypothetical protein QOK15_398 [Nocardioidaceae bacterium]|nr:hypothetical protein [Nocardioidaceae bacterium]
MTGDTLSERMAAAARELQVQHDPAATMKSAVALLVQNVEGCDAAGISIVHAKRRVETDAATGDMAVTGDRLQYELGEGPCLDAIWQQEAVYASDLATDPRWPTWARRVIEETGVRSMFCLRLFTIENTLGGLNMYSRHVDGFSPEDRAEGQALAAHIAIAVVAARASEQFAAALDSRTIIAQAVGMMMERYQIDAARAFALLTRLSSVQNVKLRDLAAEIVSTDHLSASPGTSDA